MPHLVGTIIVYALTIPRVVGTRFAIAQIIPGVWGVGVLLFY